MKSLRFPSGASARVTLPKKNRKATGRLQACRLNASPRLVGHFGSYAPRNLADYFAPASEIRQDLENSFTKLRMILFFPRRYKILRHVPLQPNRLTFRFSGGGTPSAASSRYASVVFSEFLQSLLYLQTLKNVLLGKLSKSQVSLLEITV